MPTDETKQEVQRETLENFIKRVHQIVSDSGNAKNATLKEADVYARATLQALADTLADCKYFSVSNAYSFVPQYSPERTGHNPQKPGTTVNIPAQWKYKLRLSSALKARLNGTGE